jgi:nuclear pore complex protein Nup133
MHTIGEGHYEDVMRAFFRTRASDIYQLLPHVMDIVERSTHERGRSLSNALPEANMIVLVRLDVHASMNAVANYLRRQF